MATILIAEDDKHIRLLIEKQLETNHIVLSAPDGVESWNIMLEKNIDLLIADIMMPGMDGFHLIEKIQEIELTTPILIITANQTFEYKKKGFYLGTDDYITKPFDLDELTWRVEALLKRSGITNNQKVIESGLILDNSALTLTKGDLTITLLKKEFDLLHKLLSYPGRIYTKAQLFESIWGYMNESSEDTIKTHISRLRGKISDFKQISIISIKGIGYKLEVTNEGKE